MTVNNYVEACNYVSAFCLTVNAYFAKQENTEIITKPLHEILIGYADPSSYKKTRLAMLAFVDAVIATKLPHRRLSTQAYGAAMKSYSDNEGFKAWVAATE